MRPFYRDLYLKSIETRLYSTLDRRVQATAEDLLHLHLNALKPKGITNGAIIVIDNYQHEILAMVGSADFNDSSHDARLMEHWLHALRVRYSICRGQQIPWFKAPKSVDVREVCTLSGQVPSLYCPSRIQELFLPDRSPDTICEIHNAVPIDDLTGFRLPPDYPGDRKFHIKTFVEWPPRVGSWMEANNITIGWYARITLARVQSFH